MCWSCPDAYVRVHERPVHCAKCDHVYSAITDAMQTRLSTSSNSDAIFNLRSFARLCHLRFARRSQHNRHKPTGYISYIVCNDTS